MRHMFSINKTGEGYYLASLRIHQKALGKIECNHLKQELFQVIKPHREISINMNGVKSIHKEGLRILKEIKQSADLKNCRIRFINVDPLIAVSILKLTEKKVQYHDEIESIDF